MSREGTATTVKHRSFPLMSPPPMRTLAAVPMSSSRPRASSVGAVSAEDALFFSPASNDDEQPDELEDQFLDAPHRGVHAARKAPTAADGDGDGIEGHATPKRKNGDESATVTASSSCSSSASRDASPGGAKLAHTFVDVSSLCASGSSVDPNALLQVRSSLQIAASDLERRERVLRLQKKELRGYSRRLKKRGAAAGALGEAVAAQTEQMFSAITQGTQTHDRLELQELLDELDHREEQVQKLEVMLRDREDAVKRSEQQLARREEHLVEEEERLLAEAQSHSNRISEAKLALDRRDATLEAAKQECSTQQKALEAAKEALQQEREDHKRHSAELAGREARVQKALEAADKMEAAATMLYRSAERLRTREEKVYRAVETAVSATSSTAAGGGAAGAPKTLNQLEDELSVLSAQLKRLSC